MIPYSRKRQWVKSRCLRWKKNSRASHGFHISSHRFLWFMNLNEMERKVAGKLRHKLRIDCWQFHLFFLSLSQTVTVCVSILTLTFISIDRWYAICFPLRYKPHTSRAVFWIAIIWLVSLVFDLPEFLSLHTHTDRLRFDVKLFTQCKTDWTEKQELEFCIIRAVFLYTWVYFTWNTIMKIPKIPMNSIYILLCIDYRSFWCPLRMHKLFESYGVQQRFLVTWRSKLIAREVIKLFLLNFEQWKISN